MEAVKTISPEIVCYEACDGVEGLVTLHSLVIPPDVIFLDVNMPRMNGKQFLQELDGKVAYRSIPVIMYSTTHDHNEQLEYLKMGAKTSLIKHCSFNEICDTIRGALKLNVIYIVLPGFILF